MVSCDVLCVCVSVKRFKFFFPKLMLLLIQFENDLPDFLGEFYL